MIELFILALIVGLLTLVVVVWFQHDRIRELEKALTREKSRAQAKILGPLNISDQTNEWNKMALGISRARREAIFE